MKAFVCLILLLAGCASLPDSTDVFMHSRQSVVYIQAKDAAGMPESAGTGVVLNDHCILTAGHVLEDGKDFRITLENDSYWYASDRDAIIDKDIDVGVLCTDSVLDAPPVRIANKMPVVYSRVFTIGYPLSYSKVLTEGRYMGNALVTASAAPGNSGGGIFSMEGVYIGFCDTIALYRQPVGVMTFGHLDGIVETGQIRAFLAIHHIPFTSES